MNHHLRPMAGLLAFFALSLFLAEGIWLATCTPDSGEAVVVAVTFGGTDGADPASVDRVSAEPETGCPLGLIAVGGCTSTAMPTTALATRYTHPVGAEPSPVVAFRTDRLLPSSLFRPPRA